MSDFIKTEKTKIGEIIFNERGFSEKKLLPDEIPGVAATYTALKEGFKYTLVQGDRYVKILLFTNGSGLIEGGGKSFLINEMSVFIPGFNVNYTIQSKEKNLECLEIHLELKKEEMDEIRKNKNFDPFFLEYSKCKMYKEAIKSDKTINRMLIDEKHIPRFCMGSVETTGKDMVERHEHTMLDQFFFGLPGNSCIVSANEAEIEFGENTLLHIPLASMHGIKVEEGKYLHYIWMDFFISNDMSYITENHTKVENTENK